MKNDDDDDDKKDNCVTVSWYCDDSSVVDSMR